MEMSRELEAQIVCRKQPKATPICSDAGSKLPTNTRQCLYARCPLPKLRTDPTKPPPPTTNSISYEQQSLGRRALQALNPHLHHHPLFSSARRPLPPLRPHTSLASLTARFAPTPPSPAASDSCAAQSERAHTVTMARVYADVNQQMPRAYWDYDSVNISWGVLENYEVVRKIGM